MYQRHVTSMPDTCKQSILHDCVFVFVTMFYEVYDIHMFYKYLQQFHITLLTITSIFDDTFQRAIRYGGKWYT